MHAQVMECWKPGQTGNRTAVERNRGAGEECIKPIECFKALKMRRDYLGEKIKTRDCSDRALSYHLSEHRALEWALTTLEAMTAEGNAQSRSREIGQRDLVHTSSACAAKDRPSFASWIAKQWWRQPAPHTRVA